MREKSTEKFPKFIVVDGGDGSGKDTQAKFIAQYYLERGYNVRIRSHPATDNIFGRISKKALEEGGKKGYLMAAVFYAADAIRSIVKYYRHLDNEVVIFSRYLLGVCYLPSMFVLFGYNLFATFLPTSKYSFYLDVTPEIALERISGRAEKAEMFETLPRLRKMQRKMRFVAHKKKWLVINGDRFPSKVWYQIRRNLKQLDSNT
ncbi:MAG: thymidylate kinase [Candidatus Hodarchaeales archaeon]|jgi:dTMP kinase